MTGRTRRTMTGRTFDNRTPTIARKGPPCATIPSVSSRA